MIYQNGKILLGIAATENIFKFVGILLLIAFHLITVVNPYLKFYNVSCLRVETAFFVVAETWGPRLSDAMMCGTVQFGVFYTGNILLA